jgi:predicted ArsR family transcriptional regulator
MATVDFNSLDSTVHGPVRLAILVALQTDGPLDFWTLKKQLAVTDGALGLHLQKLEETDYLSCTKAFVGRRPKSTYQITPRGREALGKYLDAMQAIIDSVQKGKGDSP